MGQYATRSVLIWQPSTPMEELKLSWGVIEIPAERATVAIERVAAILDIIFVILEGFKMSNLGIVGIEIGIRRNTVLRGDVVGQKEWNSRHKAVV
jgi:hypothetical protein